MQTRFKILIFSLFLSTCTQEESIVIPDIEIKYDGSNFDKKNGFLYIADTLVSSYLVEYHENGQIKSKQGFWKGKEHGSMISYYDDGQKKQERFYHLGKKAGVHRAWWEGGELKFEKHFENGLYEGAVKEWYRNGQLARHFMYEKGKEAGRQQWWEADGSYRANYVVKNGRRYGSIGAKPCISVNESENNDD